MNYLQCCIVLSRSMYKNWNEKTIEINKKFVKARAGTSHDPNDVIFIAFSETVGGAYIFFSLILLRKKATASLLPWRRINEAAMDTESTNRKTVEEGRKWIFLRVLYTLEILLIFARKEVLLYPSDFLCTCLLISNLECSTRNAFSNRSRRWGGAPVNLSSSQLEENRFFSSLDDEESRSFFVMTFESFDRHMLK